MVKTVHSKRKLFNGLQDLKENEPGQINSSCSKNINASENLRNISEDRKLKVGSTSLSFKKETFEDVSNTTPIRPMMPMSERQQIALLMQLSSPSPTDSSESLLPSSPQTPQLRGKRNERGETPLHVAAIKGDSSKAIQLLEEGVNVNATDYAGWTALHEACNRGFVHIASLLIDAGADVNAKGLDNDTPLHDACVNNHLKIVKLLLKAGASISAVNCRGKSPRDICRSPRILNLIEQAHTGLLDENLTTDNCNFILDMSRRTPPTNKVEEKSGASTPSSTTVTPSANVSSSIGSSNSGNGNVATSQNNSSGRPCSPRLTFRLGQMARTPDKNQTRPLEKSGENEDVYEFRCSKDESQDDKKEDICEETKQEQPSSSVADKGDKRQRETDQEEEDEIKRKRKREDAKEVVKGGASRGGRAASSNDKTVKSISRNNPSNGSNSKQTTSSSSSISTCNSVILSTSSTSLTTVTHTTTGVVSSTTGNPLSAVSSEQRKSPTESSAAANSPKITKNQGESDGEEDKNEPNSGAPKVPPLKIVLAPSTSLSEQETNTQNGKNGSNRQLPYVVNATSVDDKDNAADTKEVVVKQEEVITSNTSVSSTLSSSSSNVTITTVANSVSSVGNSSNTDTTNSNGSNNCGSSSTSGSEKGTRITRSHKGSGSGSEDTVVALKQEPKQEECSSAPTTTTSSTITTTGGTTSDVVYPRKRKIKIKEPEIDTQTNSVLEQPQQQPQQITNCYEMFLKMRRQVEERRKHLFPVQPKPPQDFEHYLMNRCSYVLAKNSNSQLSVSQIQPPTKLSQPLKDLFTEQERERYKLRLQHQIEQTKLVLSVEQEILRVHGRAARALASQVLPFSVCTILKDEEVYNMITLEQEEKDRNLRSRYNGRHFFSWLQEVDDKWEKIKENMVLRHHNEAESLHAVQKMDWEWKLKELSHIDANTQPQIDEQNVPMVEVSDFNLPA